MTTEQNKADSPLAGSVERLRQELDRWLEAAWSQGERAMDAFGRRTGRMAGPEVDVIERAEVVVVLVNVPGLDPASIDVSLSGNMLTIQGAGWQEPLLGTDRLHLAERPHGSFKRCIPLPVSVNPEAIDAQCQHGVLRLTIAKPEREKTRKVVINPGHAPPPPEPQVG